MDKEQVLCVEYNVFSRILNHWEEFEKNSLPIVLEKIIQEIEEEMNDIAVEKFKNNHYYF